MVTTVLECDCGFEASAEDEDGLVAEIRRHAREDHGMALSRREAQRVASRAVTVEGPSRTLHRQVGTRQEEES
jgi:predicted small metal-binding protein